jgi:predicted O-methyltransferase YrrM
VEPHFTTDWSRSRAHWPDLFDRLGLDGNRDRLRFLEVGCFEGQSTLWWFENVLGLTGTVTVVDPFEIEREDTPQLERFRRNLRGYEDRVDEQVGTSRGLLPLLYCRGDEYDLVYVDGSHTAADVLADAVLSWPLVRPGRAILFDDYVGLEGEAWQTPRIAVDAFVRCHRPFLSEACRVGVDQYLVVKA